MITIENDTKAKSLNATIRQEWNRGGLDIHDAILRLANSFPCLARKLARMPGWKWDAEAFDRMSGPWSTTERLTVMFILSVWNPSDFPEFKFHDFVGAFKGYEEMDAFLDWCRNPWWP